jgi:hypothetical protein
MTPQQQIKAKLAAVGIPYKEINCYGSQIIVTAWSRDAASKWASLLGKFSTVKNVVKSVDYAKKNKNTVLLPSVVTVWRVWATIWPLKAGRCRRHFRSTLGSIPGVLPVGLADPKETR